ncbi:MAG TPA: RNA methyltransferase [Kribbellaceae bacterium]
MSRLIRVEDAADQRLAEYVDLRDVNARKLLEAEHGIFIAEGEKVIRRAAEAGFEPRSFLLAERWLESLDDVLARWPQTPVYVVTPELAERVTGFHVHRGALASYLRRPTADLDAVLAGARRVVVLEDVVDHTNVGAIFRCAAGLGFDAVVIAPRCADPLYRRSIKVSMGSVFTLPYARLDDWRGGLEALAHKGFRTVALTPAPDAVPLDRAARELADEKVALLFGTEGEGLSGHWMDSAEVRVRIPMRRGIDSLNVAASAAVACYVFGGYDGEA